MSQSKISGNKIAAVSKEMPRPMKYTGDRAEQYETLKIFRHLIGPEQYRKQLNLLNGRESRSRIMMEKAAEKREAAIQKREAKREALRKQKLVLKNVSKDVLVDFTTAPIKDEDAYEVDLKPKIKEGLEKALKEKFVYIQLSVNGQIDISKLVAVKGGDAEAVFWNSIFDEICQYVNGEMICAFTERLVGSDKITLAPTDTLRFVMLRASKVPAEIVRQKYRDGVKHCVLDPLYNIWKKMADVSETTASKKRCGQIARQIKKLEETYPTGVPQDNMEAVAKIAQRCIVIHDILGREITRYNSRSNKYFRFTNTRINHLEVGELTWDGNYERVSQDEMDTILYEHDRDGVFYLYGGNIAEKNNCHSLRSVRGAYAVFNDDYDVFQAFNKMLGINDFGIDAVKYSDVNAFIKESRIINSAPVSLCDDPNDINDVKQIDLKSAYALHSMTKWYKGFLGHITTWGKLEKDVSFLDTHLGIFQFYVTSCNNELLTQLGIRAGETYILPSPEIQCLAANGVTGLLEAGCWGSTFDINYPAEMLENRRYCTWAGKLGMDNTSDSYTFKGDETWTATLKTMLGSKNVSYFKQYEMIVVNVPKKSYKTKHHILSFITSYCRINMIETMLKMKESGAELTKVIMDGIYFRGSSGDIAIPHSADKKVIQHLGFRDAWYQPSLLDCKWNVYDDRFDIPAGKVPNVVVLTGAGGTGKSHSVLQNENITDVLYVVPTHMLGRKMRSKTGCRYTTIHKLIGVKLGDKGEEKCRMWKEENGHPSAIFIDELTMIEASWIDRAIALYPNSKIFLAGDVDAKQWFQCRNGYTGHFSNVWMPMDKHHIVHYETDYRAKDDELKKLKVDIRNAMRQIFTDGNQTDAIRMKLYLKSIMPTTSWDDAVAMFQPGDIWIAGTQKTNKRLLEAGVVSGFINRDKEIVAAGSEGSEKRGAFTTHSFQGLTLETERVFISLDFFEYAMLYTSISRVCRLSQLVIVS